MVHKDCDSGSSVHALTLHILRIRALLLAPPHATTSASPSTDLFMASVVATRARPLAGLMRASTVA